MGLQPVQSPVQSFKAMSTPKKVATIAGATVAAAALISVPVAYSKGKKAGAEKFLDKFKEGYKAIGHKIAEKAKSIKNAVTKSKNTNTAEAATEK